MKKSSRFHVFLSLSLVVGVGVVILRHSTRTSPVAQKPETASASPTESPPLASRSPTPSVASKETPKPLPKDSLRPEHSQFADFILSRYGMRASDYELTFTPDGLFGHLRAKRSAPRGAPALDREKTLTQARELIEATHLSGDLAEGSLLEVAEVAAKKNGDSAVTFEQRLDGVPLKPHSELHVVFQSDGTPIGVASTLTPRLTGVQSVVKVTEPSARTLAETSVREHSSGATLPPQGGRKIYWLYDGGGKTERPIAEARIAYEYTVHEFYVVIDAATGETLYRRKKSQH